MVIETPPWSVKHAKSGHQATETPLSSKTPPHQGSTPCGGENAEREPFLASCVAVLRDRQAMANVGWWTVVVFTTALAGALYGSLWGWF